MPRGGVANPANGTAPRSSALTSSVNPARVPEASPAGFQYPAVASSATAVKAPPIPAARTPTGWVCAPARPAQPKNSPAVIPTVAIVRLMRCWYSPLCAVSLTSRESSARAVRKLFVPAHRIVRGTIWCSHNQTYDYHSPSGRLYACAEEPARAVHRHHRLAERDLPGRRGIAQSPRHAADGGVADGGLRCPADDDRRRQAGDARPAGAADE